MKLRDERDNAIAKLKKELSLVRRQSHYDASRCEEQKAQLVLEQQTSEVLRGRLN